MDEMFDGLNMGARSVHAGRKRGGALQRALVGQWQAAGYLVMAAGILLALTLMRDADGWRSATPVLGLLLSLLAPSALAGIFTRLRRLRLAAVGCYLGTCSSLFLSFWGFCSAGLLLSLQDFGLALEYAVWAMLLGAAALSLSGAFGALRGVNARARSSGRGRAGRIPLRSPSIRAIPRYRRTPHHIDPTHLPPAAAHAPVTGSRGVPTPSPDRQ